MTYLDWIVVGFLVVGLITGYFKGFISQLFTVVGLVLGYFLSRLFNENLTVWLQQQFPILSLQTSYLSFGILFVLGFIVAKVVGSIIEKPIANSPLASFNKLLGSLLGGIKYLLILVILDVFASQMNLPSQSDLSRSTYYQLIRNQSKTVLHLVDISSTIVK